MVKEKKLKGFGGWLIAFQFELWGQLFISLMTIFILNIILALFFIAFTIVELIFFYQKKKNFILLGKIGLVISLIFEIGIVWVGTLMGAPTDSSNPISAYFGIGISRIIWFLYLVKSERVKKTFVKK
ncbi:MAG: DUF2569 domain-containing protein [Nanoarchaeota archaeon]|nr:DUF2569 domain-containing protein [Nanoarchaeota archaeon]